MGKDKLLLYALILVLCLVLYKLITFFIFNRLKRKLIDADLHTFTSYFGEDYAYRFVDERGELRRYKWRKGLLIVKASFDRQDRLTYERMLPFDLFTLFTKIVFN